MGTKTIIAIMFCTALMGIPQALSAQRVVHDDQKFKQWRSMENGPWDFAPDWYYYFLHKNYSGAEMYWKWAGFKSGYRVRFKEEKSNVKRIMPVRITAEETQQSGREGTCPDRGTLQGGTCERGRPYRRCHIRFLQG